MITLNQFTGINRWVGYISSAIWPGWIWREWSKPQTLTEKWSTWHWRACWSVTDRVKFYLIGVSMGSYATWSCFNYTPNRQITSRKIYISKHMFGFRKCQFSFFIFTSNYENDITFLNNVWFHKESKNKSTKSFSVTICENNIFSSQTGQNSPFLCWKWIVNFTTRSTFVQASRCGYDSSSDKLSMAFLPWESDKRGL